MSDWQPIETVAPDTRVIVFCPRMDIGEQVFEAKADQYGDYGDPVYSEWSGAGATHWMPLPAPPPQRMEG